MLLKRIGWFLKKMGVLIPAENGCCCYIVGGLCVQRMGSSTFRIWGLLLQRMGSAPVENGELLLQIMEAVSAEDWGLVLQRMEGCSCREWGHLPDREKLLQSFRLHSQKDGERERPQALIYVRE